RRFASRKTKLPRRLVFIAFTGEEKGLFGSAEYVKNPVFPLEKTIAMINMDMVGRLQDDKLTIFGTGTSSIWPAMLERLAKQDKFELTMKPEGFGPSDQSSFYAKEIPVLHFFTGNHTDYHRPSDDWEKINISGMNRVADMVEQVVTEVDQAPEKPDYIRVKSASMGPGDGSRPYFGSIPNFGSDKPGYALQAVAPNSPAEKAGLKGGDRIIKMAGKKIDNLEDFDLALRKLQAGETVEVVVARDDKEVTVKVTLDKPR
ncbi:MAG TPA: M28 family peptidase, partial [Planctomycetaceae bacterium]|nr:M28 family peptidase [Planctomycetaceae bacterium]